MVVWVVKFGYTIIYVNDVDKTLSFFENAFGLVRNFLTPEGDYGELSTGETTLSFASHDLGKSNFNGGYKSVSDSEQPLGFEVALVTSDVDSAHSAALQNGAQELSPPQQKPWGQIVSYIRCPSGVLIELCTPLQSWANTE